MQSVVKKLGFSDFFVKFDVVLNENHYVLLDIGIDPPYRMRNYYENRNLNFVRMYIGHYMLGRIEYPTKEKI